MTAGLGQPKFKVSNNTLCSEIGLLWQLVSYYHLLYYLHDEIFDHKKRSHFLILWFSILEKPVGHINCQPLLLPVRT